MTGTPDQHAAAEPDVETEEVVRQRYFDIMQPLFMPERPTDPDIIHLFASLLRIVGMEDKGWDPYAESRAIIDDIYAMMQMKLPGDRFPNPNLTVWRLGLLFYSHIVEMDAPYEVLANLLRYRLGKGYSPNPYYAFLTDVEKKQFKKRGLYPRDKIAVIRRLGAQANVDVASIFDELYRPELRNAINHADFIFTDTEFRSRKGYGGNGFVVTLVELDQLISRAKCFIGCFFEADRQARTAFGMLAGSGKPYDPNYKGIMEVLAGADGLMNGFKVHWPNGSDSFYRRTADGIDMCNCMLDFPNATIQLFVGQYARQRSAFSPLVEWNEMPGYTPVEGSSEPLTWTA